MTTSEQLDLETTRILTGYAHKSSPQTLTRIKYFCRTSTKTEDPNKRTIHKTKLARRVVLRQVHPPFNIYFACFLMRKSWKPRGA